MASSTAVSSPLSIPRRTLSLSPPHPTSASLPQFSFPKSNKNPIKSLSIKCTANDDSKELPIELKYAAFPIVMDINQIREILPHRFPFLLVDRVVEYNPGVSAVAIKNVTINDNFFPGHFPERPIMPGVLMVEVLMYSLGALTSLIYRESPNKSDDSLAGHQSRVSFVWSERAMAQVGGIVMLQPEVGGSRENFFFAGIDNCRFRKPVIAGDTLVMRMTLTKLQKRFGIAKMAGKAYVGGEVVCEGDFLMAMGS